MASKQDGELGNGDEPKGAEMSDTRNVETLVMGSSSPTIASDAIFISTIANYERCQAKKRRFVDKIFLNTFATRLKAVFQSWEECREELWACVDAIVVASPPPTSLMEAEDKRYKQSMAFHIWLFGTLFPETVMLFLPGSFHILCSQKQARMFPEEAVYGAPESLTGIEVIVHDQMQTIFDALKWKLNYNTDSRPTLSRRIKYNYFQKKSPRFIGCLRKEPAKGTLMKRWFSHLDQVVGWNLLDVTDGLSEVVAVKDEFEINNVTKASLVSSSVLKNYVVPRLEEVMHKAESVSHAELQEDTEAVIWQPNKAKVDLRSENVDICSIPFFQSGGKFDPYAIASSNDDPLYYGAKGVILCGLGACHKDYCSNIARTYLIDPDGYQEKAYKLLLQAHEEAIDALWPGRSMSAVYKAALDVVLGEGSEFQLCFRKSVGAGIGIQFCEKWLTLSASNERVLKAGMVFNIVTGFHDLEIPNSKNPKIRKFSLLLADTVVVSTKGPEITTGQCSKSFTDIVYSLKGKMVDEAEVETEGPSIDRLDTRDMHR